MKVIGLAGWSGSGKTTLVCKLIPELTGRGYRVSTMKHAHHAFDVDKPGKDSYQHREAGASEVLITSGKRWALMHELRDEPEPSWQDLIGHMTQVDLLIIEGFKRQNQDKIEVFRREVGKPLLALEMAEIVAVLSDGPVPEAAGVRGGLQVIDLNDIAAIADFIEGHCDL